MPFMQVDQANITSLARKKRKVTITTKPDENVSKTNEKVPKPGSSPQAPGLPLTNMAWELTPTQVWLPLVNLANSNNKIPQPTVLHPKSTKQLDKTHTVPSTPVLSEPSVANLPVRVLVHSLEEFIASCSASKDSNVSARLPDEQKDILTFIGAVTTVR